MSDDHSRDSHRPRSTPLSLLATGLVLTTLTWACGDGASTPPPEGEVTDVAQDSTSETSPSPDTTHDDTTPSDTTSTDTTSPDTSPGDTNIPDTSPGDTNTPDTNTPDTEPADTSTPDTEPADTNTPDTEPADTNTPDTEPADTNTPDTEPSDTAEEDTEDTEDTDTSRPTQPLGAPCDEDYPCGPEGYCTLDDAACGLGFQVTCCLARADLGEACEAWHPMSCLGTLGCVTNEAAGCYSATGYCCAAAGGLDEPCHPETGCGEGLGCYLGTCVLAGAAGQPCLADWTCDTSDLTCLAGLCRPHLGVCGIGGSCPAGARCVETDRRLCFSMGDLHEPCNPDNTCNDPGHICQSAYNIAACTTQLDDSCCAPPVPLGGDCERGILPCGDDAFCGYNNNNNANCSDDYEYCCQPRRGLGSECDGDNNRCLQGSSCVSTWSNAGPCPEGISYCCVEAGEAGQACRPDGTCVDGYGCLGSLCVEAGGQSQPCLAGNVCLQADLACVEGICQQHHGPCGPGSSCPAGSVCAPSRDSQVPDLCLSTGALWQWCSDTEPCRDPGTVCGLEYTDYRQDDVPCHADFNTCCVPILPVGASCDYTYQCGGDAFCDDGPSCPDDQECCQERSDAGGECNGDVSRCKDGLFCVYNRDGFAPCAEDLDYCCSETLLAPGACGDEPGVCVDWQTDLTAFSPSVAGQTFLISLPPTQSVACGGWGTDIYTYDSDIGCAAVHRGLLSFGSGGTVLVRYLGLHEGFLGSTRNGVTTYDYYFFPAYEFVVDPP